MNKIEKFQKGKVVQKVRKILSEAERLGIPKSERFNPKSLENPIYWGYQQWTQRYNDAIKAKNWSEVQKLRNWHFKLKAPNTVVTHPNGDPLTVYHGSPNIFTIFKSDPSIKRLHTASDSFYFTDLKDIASSYGSIIYPSFLNITNPFVRNFRGGSWNSFPRKTTMLETQQYLQKRKSIIDEIKSLESEINTLRLQLPPKSSTPFEFKFDSTASIPLNIFEDSSQSILNTIALKQDRLDYLTTNLRLLPADPPMFKLMTTDDLISIAKRKGHDGVIFKNIRDVSDPHLVHKLSTDFVGFTPEQIKSSNPVTYDNFGNIIPIIKRDNFRRPDFRYSNGGKIEKFWSWGTIIKKT